MDGRIRRRGEPISRDGGLTASEIRRRPSPQ